MKKEEARRVSAWVRAEPATCEAKQMIPLEHQVCSRELATRLAELGGACGATVRVIPTDRNEV